MQISEELKNEFEKIKVPSNEKKWQLIKYCSSIILTILSTILFIYYNAILKKAGIDTYYTLLMGMILVYPFILLEIIENHQFKNKKFILKVYLTIKVIISLITTVTGYYFIQWAIDTVNIGLETGYYPKKLGVFLFLIVFGGYHSFKYLQKLIKLFKLTIDCKITHAIIDKITEPKKDKSTFRYIIDYKFTANGKIYNSSYTVTDNLLKESIEKGNPLEVLYSEKDPNINIII